MGQTMYNYREKLESELYKISIIKATQHFHEPSKTYIYYYPGIIHFCAKVIGDFPNETIAIRSVSLYEELHGFCCLALSMALSIKCAIHKSTISDNVKFNQSS